MTTFTICIPTYNGEKYLAEAMNSALGQVDNVSEIIVSDDHSTDKTSDILAKYSHPKLKIVRPDKNLGMVGNWNFLAKQVQSTHFMILHQDDSLLPNYVREMLLAVEVTKADFIYCDVLNIDEDGREYLDPRNKIKRKVHGKGQRLYDIWNNQQLAVRLLSGNVINCPTVVYKKDAYQALGVFNPQYRFVQDWEYWFRIALSERSFAHINKSLYRYRIHAGSATSQYKSSKLKYYERNVLVNKMFDEQVSRGWVNQESWYKVEQGLYKVILWDAVEHLALGQKELFDEKLKLGKELFEGFLKYPLSKLILLGSFLGKPWGMFIQFVAKVAYR